MRMELLPDSDNLVIKPYRAFQILSKEQLSPLLGILNQKSDFMQFNEEHIAFSALNEAFLNTL